MALPVTVGAGRVPDFGAGKREAGFPPATVADGDLTDGAFPVASVMLRAASGDI